MDENRIFKNFDQIFSLFRDVENRHAEILKKVNDFQTEASSRLTAIEVEQKLRVYPMPEVCKKLHEKVDVLITTKTEVTTAWKSTKEFCAIIGGAIGMASGFAIFMEWYVGKH